MRVYSLYIHLFAYVDLQACDLGRNSRRLTIGLFSIGGYYEIISTISSASSLTITK
jgi:hypothetical protein